MIAFGASDMTKAYVGSTEVSKVNLGDELVWGGDSPALPYDSEIEYLESSGNGISTGQVINSNVLIPASCSHVEYHFKFMFVKNQKGVLCGHQTTSHGNPRTYLFYSSMAQNAREFYAGNKIGSVSIPSQEIVDGYITLDEGGTLAFYRNGTLVNQFTLSGSALNKDFPLIIFGGSYGNSLDDLASIRLWDFSIIHGDTLVRDYIPVRVGTVGYMYDRVSGELFGNSGTGSFTLGADV